jgi:hypothetical protein
MFINKKATGNVYERTNGNWIHELSLYTSQML